MSKVVAFTVPEGGSIYQLDVANTLVGFLEYDFTYFWEQCLELAHKSRLTGEYYAEYAVTLGEYIRTCHPYYNVLIHRDFSKIVLDCVIDFIYQSEGVGLEELWVRYISAKDAFGREVFSRISEYKTGCAINQWANLLRMQEYAASKAAFVFDGPVVSPAEYYSRKQYFDLAFSLTAREMGYRPEELPQVRSCSVGLLPDGGEIAAKLTKSLLPQAKQFAGEKRQKTHGRKTGCMQDQAGGLIAGAMTGLRRPEPIEMETAIDLFREMPGEVYVPSCLKAIIDLEFDKMLEEKLILRRKPDGKGYVIAGHFGRDTPVEAQIPLQQPAMEGVREFAPPKIETEPSAPQQPATVSDEPVVGGTEATPSAVVYPAQTAVTMEVPLEPVAVPAEATIPAQPDASRPELVQKMAQDSMHLTSGKKSAQNINVRCQLVYTALYTCVTNKTMSEREFEEWSHQLMGIRRSIIKREMTVDDLERYLDATEQIYPQIGQDADKQ